MTSINVPTPAPVDEIADRAALSTGTVRNYLSNAVTKLGVTNRHEAVRVARERGWIQAALPPSRAHLLPLPLLATSA